MAQTLIGKMTMSEGFIEKLQKRGYEKLSNFDNEINEKIKFYKAHEKKDKIGIDEDGILPYLNKETIVVHDHNKVNNNSDYDFTNA